MLVDVLIVEDEPVVIESAARILGSEGLSVRLAADAAGGVEELRRGAFKVVLCDLMLPGDSGFRVLETARDLRPDAQVIVISGYTTCGNALESFGRGAFDFLPKPFDVDELLATVTRALRCHERASGPPDSATDLYLLGRHAWASEDADGSITLGLGDTLTGLLGAVAEVELPEPDRHLLQCRRCSVIRCRDRLEHRVWAPLSGRVIAVNRSLESDPDQLDRGPREACWLARIISESPAEELSRLTHQ